LIPRSCRRAVVASLTLSALLSPACRTEPKLEERRKAAVRIVLIGRSRDDPTWAILEALAEDESAVPERLLVEALAPSVPTPRVQQELLQEAGRSEADVICLHPIEPSGTRAIIDDLVRRGRPVVLFGRDVPSCNRAGYCGPGEFDLGAAAAAACRVVSTERSNSIMLLHAGANSVDYGGRYAGFMSAIPAAPGLKILRNLACSTARFEALALVKEEFHKYPRAAGWVLLDDWPLRALPTGERLVPEPCAVILCSADPRYLGELSAGRITAMLAFDYRRAVREALIVATRLARADTKGILLEVNVPPQVVTRENIAEWEHLWKAWQQGRRGR